jgi:hypothetical protein
METTGEVLFPIRGFRQRLTVGNLHATLCFAIVLTVLTALPTSHSPAGELDNMTYLGFTGPPVFRHLLDVWVGQELAYVTGLSGLTVADITDPTNPTYLDHYSPPTNVFYNAAVDESNGLAYCVARKDGLFVVSTSDPQNLGLLFHETYDDVFIEGAALGNQALYCAAHEDGIFVYDLALPPSPSLTNTVTDQIEDAWRLAVKDGFLLVADGSGGVKILDASDPLNPTVVHSVATSGEAKELAVIEDLLVVAAGGGGMDILDVTDPAAATLLGTYDSPNPVFDVAGHDGLAAVAAWNQVEIVDLTNPSEPTLAGWEMTPDRAMGVWMKHSDAGASGARLPGPVVYVADWGEFRLYEYGPPYDADIQVFPTLLDSQPVGSGTVVDTFVTAINTGGLSVMVADINISGENETEFEVLTTTPLNIAPGDSVEVDIRYTASEDSSAYAQFRFFCNDPDESPFQVQWAIGTGLDIGEPAPDFTLMGLDGFPHTLSDQLGKVVTLAFFATW